MKKVVFGFILGVIVCLSIQGFADTISIFKAERATFEVYVKDQKFQSDKPIVTIGGSTYLPLKDIGNTLGVPVEWNSNKKRVEIDMHKVATVNKVELLIKSKALTVNEDYTPAPKIIESSGKYYLFPMVISSYIKTKGENGNDIYLELPGKEPILIKSQGKQTGYAIEYSGYTYIDLDACGINHQIEDGVLWID
mgnify:CR=1 FL=1